MDVEGLHDARVHLAVVHLPALEARQRRRDPAVETHELLEGAAVVGEALDVHEGDPVDLGRPPVVLHHQGPLGEIGQLDGIGGAHAPGSGLASIGAFI